MLEALLATIIRPCLGQGSNKSTPMPKDEANELFGTLRAEEILAINTAFREQLRVTNTDTYLIGHDGGSQPNYLYFRDDWTVIE